jgi:hypothetical protein
MTDYTAFFLNNSGGVVQLECLEITHPSFEHPFCYIRNDTSGVQIGGQFYQYQPMSIKRSNVTNDLDQQLSITLADMQDELMDALENIDNTPFENVRPQVKSKIYRDDDLSSPMIEMQMLEVDAVSKDSTGLVTFDAKAAELNSVRTGRLYTFEDYPLLRGI